MKERTPAVPRLERRMVKCYFVNGDPDAKCNGYISENFTEPQGNVTYFEQWLLLPLRFSPRRKLRSRIIEESRRAMSASMSKSGVGAREAAVAFYPALVAA